VTGQRSDQLSYVPRLFFNNLGLCHIESSGSQLSLFSLFSTISLLWTQFPPVLDTKWTPNWTPNQPNQRRNLVYQMSRRFGVHPPRGTDAPNNCSAHPEIDGKCRSIDIWSFLGFPYCCSSCNIHELVHKADGFVSVLGSKGRNIPMPVPD